MMAPGMTVMLPIALLLLLVHGTLPLEGLEFQPISLTVENELSNEAPKSYSCHVVTGGILLGAMRRLQDNDHDFKFTVIENLNYGPYLESVNGIAGKEADSTYWEILSKSSSGNDIPLDVGVGCYQPKANEHIILRFRKWTKQ